MLISDWVKIKWHYIIKEHYELKGYPFTKYGDEFLVKVSDLTKGSNVLVDIKCDCEDCKNPYLPPMTYNNYNNYIHENNKYYCNKCALKLFGSEKSRKAKLKNSKSFYDWCYNNFSKEEADIIMLRWDYDKNIKNGEILSPKDVSFKSSGFNKKGYWFKCLDQLDHESELKFISHLIGGRKGSLNCNQCNTISITHPELIKYLVNKKDAYRYSYGSTKSISMICPDCKYEKKMTIDTLIRYGFGCVKCSDGRSFSEKFVFIFLEQLLDKSFQAQLTRTTYKWCNNYKYDFYIDNISSIIETHGLQHYEGGFERIKSSKHIKTLEENQENDKIKEQLAKENGIKNYIILDCRKSELEWIKNNILNSKLVELFDFKEEDINWLKCHEYACNSLVKEACDLWNSGININDIAEKFKLHSVSIRRYLKQGTKLGWCDYDSKTSLLYKKCHCKKAICLTTNEIFNSILEASKKHNIYSSSITECCKNKVKSAGKHPETGEKLKWMYYDEYVKENVS